MKNIDDIKLELIEFNRKLGETLDRINIPEKEKRLSDLSEEQKKPEVYNNLEESTRIARQIKIIQNQTQPWKELKREADDLTTLIEMAEEEGDSSFFEEILTTYKKLEKIYHTLEISLLFKEETDVCNAFLSIHAGAGGTESCDWAMMLYRMYTRYAEQKKFKIALVDYQANVEAGIKSATLYVEGTYAYGLLKAESGVHRLVRISPFDANKKRHTSFCSVHVSAEIEDSIEVNIADSDLRVDTYRSSGAGGQHVNTTDSAVRITHVPTGIVVTSQSQRSQIQNRSTAMKVLRGRLYEYYKEEREKNMQTPDKKKIEWGSQIRSYVFHPYYLVKDHRTEVETSNIQAVMDGDLDDFIYEYLKS